MSYNFLSAILFFAHTIALLMISGDQYALKMRFVDHVFDEQVIDSLTVKIILPEGAKNIQVDSPYDISRAPDELHYTYLDTFGRPVIVAYKKNLVEQHIQDIVVSGSAVCGWGCGQDVSCSSLTFAFLCPGSHAGALHVQQGSHAAGAAAGRGRLLHPVLHRHHLRPSGLFHHQGTLLSSSVSGVLVPP